MPALQSIEIDLLQTSGVPSNIDRMLAALSAWLHATHGTVRRVFLGLKLDWPDHTGSIPRFMRGLPRFSAAVSTDSMFVFKSKYHVQYHMVD